ncbi:FAD/NAD(P)-binding domain-containing protein [Cristinia sonorae]|uniref:FAD/NAD(P)-binding domain-containing protein n=1 Tax=Cristinia sonorae TaxID=1940300 RepID=A0A8K0UM48_9AGAR|nr:FAD/NAD(P)-binding domain-containing protein [Cristinia sonorae]
MLASSPKYLTSHWFNSSAACSKPRLVILGSGWGGYEILRGVNKSNWNVTIVSPSNYFNFTPLLASCAVGTLEFRAAVEPVRRFTPEVTAYQAWCDSIDFKNKSLKCVPATPRPVTSVTTTLPDEQSKDSFTLHYDKLVIAVGAYSQTFNLPGVKEHAHFLKDIKDARAIRVRVLECFEQAAQPTVTDSERRNLLHFCIVGGGPTGVEFAAELHDLLHTDIKRHYPALADLAKISLFDVAPNILGGFDTGLQEYAMKKFKREGIQILTQRHVERVEKASGKLFVQEEGEVPFGILVWSTGLAPNPLIESISEVQKDPKTSSVITDEHLNVIMKDTKAVHSDVFAIGDAATVKDDPLPATAQVANQKAIYLTKKLNSTIRGKKHLKPFRFHNSGSLAYLGDWEAVYDRTKVRGPKSRWTGRIAWLLWRSAYFTKTVSIRNKILVPTYWFMNWIFGRDLSRF